MAIAEYPKHLAVRMSRELSEKLKAVADEQNVSVSDFVRRLIENRLAD
jgi:predicted HicB family RNase H-like nuclease